MKIKVPQPEQVSPARLRLRPNGPVPQCRNGRADVDPISSVACNGAVKGEG
jgi:hypothetical protein